MSRKIGLNDRVRARDGLVAADVGGELVILSVEGGEYFGLNSVGSRIWELLAEPRQVGRVREQLLVDYPDVDPVRCTHDLLTLLADLYSAALIEVEPGDP